jgi:DNA segregation ATPase FtsK/SpoIIIE, S-DNA-T family
VPYTRTVRCVRLANVARSKARKKQEPNRFDIEAFGLILLALGIVLFGFMLPGLPTGALGAMIRGTLTGSFGVLAYALPLPLLVVGALFVLNRNPGSLGRLVAGYFLFAIGIWFVLSFIAPQFSGSWGLGFRQVLPGIGWLLLVPSLFLTSVGVDLLIGWQPTRLARGTTRLTIHGARTGIESFLAWRQHLKERAAFYADVAIVKRELKDLDIDLQALAVLYPGSAEVSKWRKELMSMLKRLKDPTDTTLEEAEAHLKAWKRAVTDFAKERSGDVAIHLTTEDIPEFEMQVKELEAQLTDNIPGGLAIVKPLETLRKTLSVDVMGIAERYHKLLRERDTAKGSLKGLRPRELAVVAEAHQGRLGQYQNVQAELNNLGEEISLLMPWHNLAEYLSNLKEEFADSVHSKAGAVLKEFDETLAKELAAQGRKELTEVASWTQTLQSIEGDIRSGATQTPQLEADWLEEEDNNAELGDDSYQNAGFSELEEVEDVEEEYEEGEGVQPINQDEYILAYDDDLDEVKAALDIPPVGGIPIQLPPLDLLDAPQPHHEDPDILHREVNSRVKKIDETLSNFRLEGRVVSKVRGPTVTRFEVEPAPGEKISRFAGLSDDLALAMAVGSVRIEAPIPGKSVIGLEVPNANRDLIRFREAVESPNFRRSKARLPLILGKSIDSEMVVADLARMPHLLIAGSTGSGKSVAVNTLISSLLFKFLPTELRFLMIDPKMVELTPYDGVPHLLRPVVTNPNDAAGVLLGAVAHMERRYKMMSKIGAKNLDQYNEKARNLDMPEMPFIIIVIDELADLMITSPKEVESAIMRLAQMARATGMHLVLATQRPSVDILTSLIKVNVPARMAFAVSSGHDSRTILDSMGAERLIGLGDMLYYQPGMVKPARLQGPFISENEITATANFLRRQYFDDEFVEAYGTDFEPVSSNDSQASGLIDWNDDKLREAAELVINEGQASVSRLQRRLMVGHARAGKLMDSLEALGVVGVHSGSKPRDVLVTFDELPNIFGK